MRIFGFEITRAKEYLSVGGGGYAGWFGGVSEPFAGAWQANIIGASRQNATAFSGVYACCAQISTDVSKLPPLLMQQSSSFIWSEVRDPSPFKAVLEQPNDYQTIVQFLSNWIVSKLLYGNTYVYIQRDARGIPNALYVLDPRLVTPKISETGAVYYALKSDRLAGLQGDEVVVGASEIMHDRAMCLFHPLIGVSPIYACATTAAQGIRIQANSAKFFENMSRPSGILTSPDKITDEHAKSLKAQFESAMTGGNIGRLLVVGNGLSYSPMMMSATDAQLIEQLRWTVEDVARCFQVPLHKIGAAVGQPFANIASLNQDYYNQTLQGYLEAIEALFNAHLGVRDVPGKTYKVQFDLEGLLRMDPLSRAERHAKLVGGGIESPDEARAAEDLAPVDGGDTPYMQQQNYSLKALAKRDSGADPFGKAAAAPKPPTEPATPPALPAPASSPQPSPAKFAALLCQRLDARAK